MASKSIRTLVLRSYIGNFIMENKRIFVVVSAAIPKIQKLNTIATRVSAACLRASRADAIAKFIQETQQKNIVYGFECTIHTSVIDVELNGELNDGEQHVYIIVSAAIPIRKGMNPVQSRVHSVWTDRNKAEQKFTEIVSKKDVNVKNILCDVHATIIDIKLDKS